MNGHVGNLTVDRFGSLLEVYGGNLARWPAQQGLAAHALLQESAEARSRLAEAQALDRVLDKASAPDPRRLRRLADRIVAEAAAGSIRRDVGHQSAPGRDEGARVIQLPLPKKAGARAQPDVPVVAPRLAQPPRRQWRAAAALAASLLMGIVIGLTDIAETTTLGVASLGGTSASDTETILSALQLDEDQI